MSTKHNSAFRTIFLLILSIGLVLPIWMKVMPLVQAKELPLLEDIVSFTPDKEFCLNAFYRTAIDWSDEVLHQDICQDYWTEEKVKQLKEIEGLFL